MTYILIISVLIVIVAITLVKEERKANIALVSVLVNALFSSWIAVLALKGNPYSAIIPEEMFSVR